MKCAEKTYFPLLDALAKTKQWFLLGLLLLDVNREDLDNEFAKGNSDWYWL